jgi:hypothetical protein
MKGRLFQGLFNIPFGKGIMVILCFSHGIQYIKMEIRYSEDKECHREDKVEVWIDSMLNRNQDRLQYTLHYAKKMMLDIMYREKLYISSN